MTTEEIAAFWGRVSNCDCYAQSLVPRLLEERKRLIEALRPFAETGGAATFRVQMHNYGMPIKEHDVARAAMAFAEAPTE